MPVEWIIVVSPLVTLALWALVFRRGRRSAASGPAEVRRIRIKGVYNPSELHVRAGEPTQLIFYREETAPCSERVVFPEFGISVMLPAFEEVAVDLPPMDPGEHKFTCQMRMLHGKLIADAATAHDQHRQPAAARALPAAHLIESHNPKVVRTESTRRRYPVGRPPHEP